MSEKRECAWCQPDKSGDVAAARFGSLVQVSVWNQMLEIVVAAGQDGRPKTARLAIQYCPMCGRKFPGEP